MAGTGDKLELSVAAMVEDVLLEHGKELCAVNASRNDAKAKAATKRNEATRWLRKMVGVVAAKDLPSEPSEEDFRMGLRSGIILCTVLNKIEPGAIPKIVEAPFDSVIVPDGEPLSECLYFDNITNFLEAIEERGLPSFEVDDLEQWGRLPKVVNCVLALNSYSNWKKEGGNGSFRYDGNPKASSKRKQIVRKSLDMDKCDLWKDVKDKPLHMRIRDLLSDKKPEDIPVVVEIVLRKLIEEFEKRLESHKEKMRQNAIAKEKSEALARARNEEIKASPRDRNKEMELKMRSKLKKEEFVKPITMLNNDKEENASSENKTNEETKSFSEIIKEMRRKAAANDISNEMEKKTPTFAKKFPSDINNETPKKAATSDGIEKIASIFAKKFPIDINNETPKKATTDTTSNINNATEAKKSISDIFNQMEKKSTTEAKKSIGDIFNQAEKKPTTEAKKSISDAEKKPTTEAKKPTSDVFNQAEKKPTTEAKKPISDVSNQVEKKPITEAKKPISDVLNQAEKKPATEAKKAVSDVPNQVEKKPTTEAKKAVSDVSNQVEKKPTIEAKKSVSDVNSETEKKPTTEAKKAVSDVSNQVEKKATPDVKKSTGDVKNEMDKKASTDGNKSNDMEQKATTDIKMSAIDINFEMEEEESTDTESPVEDINDEMEEEETSDVETSADDDVSEEVREQRKKEAEQRKKLAEQRKKEMEQKEKEMEEKKEMERMKEELEMEEEMERKREIERKREMEERKREMERKAAEDAKEEEYYNWVHVECGRLSASAIKQQKLVEHQYKQLQVLKNIFSAAKADLELMRTKHHQEFDDIGKHLRNLAQQASGYKKVVDENRKLYNLVQDLKGNIRVYCRSRPFLTTTTKKSAVDCIDETNVAVITIGKGGKETRKVYTFNRVFSLTATQAEVYKDTQPLIRSVLDGYNICIFAYGQTGSGKTFTMTGPENLTPETMGVNYRALNDLFEIQQQRKEMITYLVRVQMLEIYNETVRDLLSPNGTTKKLDIRLGAQDGINVPDAELIPVSTTEDVIHLMTLGHKNRAVGSTAMNDRSSRSHSCVTVHVSGKDLTSGSTVRGCMHLVDLAGSERADKTEATGDRLKEATHINKSLSALGDVIASLSQKNAHVPYRNSKLTLLLQDALGGQAKTLMFIHVSPDPDTVGETISTLKFAERVSTVELGAAKSNKDIIDLKELKDQVAALKAALAKEGGDINISNVEENVADEDEEEDPGTASKAKKAGPAQAKGPSSAPAAKSSPAPAAKSGKPAAAPKKAAPDAKKKGGK
ncbi:kinesin-like protein KIN-14G [Cynara cardunculus var. scolymus]|uniref:kinesin-like protein KIN-14G n=1 Tax=Cynara cardunculus var. scolymus TaxID=59895 RepID=UPI000D627716|nr:kinesin-like protein KIN-14G [Cynara cardunculus var. scolymus]